MAWLGSTIKSLDTRKEFVNYIGGNTQPSRVVVTNSGGEIDSSVVTVAEMALLSGVSSNVQTQLTDLGDDKEDEITGAATTVTSNNLTSNRVLLSDGNGKISASEMTAATFAHLDPTSSLQTQLNGKHPSITVDAPLSQSRVNGLANSLSGKQPTIGSGTSLVVNKITFGSGESAVAFQGSYSELTSKPALFDGDYASLSSKPVLFDGAYSSLSSRPALFDGAYSSLSSRPALFDGAYSSLSSKPVLFDGAYSSLSSKPVLFDGAYSSLSSKPALFDGDYTNLTSKPTLFDGAYSSLSSKPVLFDGAYSSLSSKPTLVGQGDPMTCVTEQVTGNNPVYTTGALHIDNLVLTYIPFAGTFTNFGINHPTNSSLFNINVANEYTVNVQLRVTAGGNNERGMYWVILRRYKQRPANGSTRGTQVFRDYYLGSSYYRDETTTHNDVVLGGNVRVHFESNDENFEIVVQRAYQQNVNSGNCTLNNSQSFITIERHAYQVS